MIFPPGKDMEKRFQDLQCKLCEILKLPQCFFSFILNGKTKISKYLGFVPCKIASEQDRPD